MLIFIPLEFDRKWSTKFSALLTPLVPVHYPLEYCFQLSELCPKPQTRIMPVWLNIC